MRGPVKVLAVCAAVVVFALLGYAALRSRSADEPRSAPSSAPAPDPPGTLRDAVRPDAPLSIDSARAAAPNWLRARPAFQYSRPAAERGGVEPCQTQPVDDSAFETWAPLANGRLTAPRELGLDGSGRFELIIHLHGDEPVRRELIESGQRFVLATFTFDPSRSYAPLFNTASAYSTIVAGVEQAISQRAGKPARAAHVALSAWSAGFVGVEAALLQPASRDRMDAVILIDGLHAPRGDRAAFEAQLKPFVDYAARAAAGERFFYVSHSAIDPPNFASTTECAHYLIAEQHGRPQPVRRSERYGLELVEYFSRGDFHVRGYAGNDKADHCAQLALLRDVFTALGRRWKHHE